MVFLSGNLATGVAPHMWHTAPMMLLLRLGSALRPSNSFSPLLVANGRPQAAKGNRICDLLWHQGNCYLHICDILWHSGVFSDLLGETLPTSPADSLLAWLSRSFGGSPAGRLEARAFTLEGPRLSSYGTWSGSFETILVAHVQSPTNNGRARLLSYHLDT